MRFLKFFVPVFVVLLSFSFVNSAQAIRIDNFPDNYNPIVNAINGLKDQNTTNSRKHKEEGTNVDTGAVGETAKQFTASDTNRAKTVGEDRTVNIMQRYNNRGDYICSLVSMQQDVGKTFENADLVGDELRKARNANYFQNSEKGLKQFGLDLYDKMQSLPNERVDIGELFFNPVVPTSGVIATNLDYLEKVLFQRVPLHWPEDLKNNPDTDIKNTIVMSDRIAAESRIGSTTLSMLQGMHAPTPGVGAAQWIKEVMTENGYTSQYIDKQLNNGSPSKYGILKALSIGQVGQKYGLEKFMTTPENYDSAILFQIMVGNMLLFEQYNLLQAIAMSTSTNVIANREEAIKDVNYLVENKKLRQ